MGHETVIEPQSEKVETNGRTTEFSVSGMTCGNCARHVTEAIQSVPGVRSASVSLESQQATVRWSSPEARDVLAVVRSVEEAGYAAKVLERAHAIHPEHKLAGWQTTLWVGVLGTAPLMLGEWVFGLAATPWFQWFSFALATVVQVYAGASFYRGALAQLKVGSSNMDTLVALGSTTAYGYSVWALLSGAGGHVYFMEAASIITLISVGHWIESRVSVKASSALHQLLSLAPPTARRRAENGAETEVPIADLRPGDVVILRPGDRVPTDGQVLEGDGAVDESMLTGESVPVDKTTDSLVYTGTTNLNGRLAVRVTVTGEETALANIIAAVQRAQTSRANIQRLADRVSNVFVPVVVCIAIAAALWWGLAPGSARAVHGWLSQFLWHTHVPPTTLAAAFITAAAVLIIACPCAMGLATPAAIMAGSNAAAQRGILVRDGVALEKAGHITAVLFDKTGTLTAGKPVVAEVWTPERTQSPRLPEVGAKPGALENTQPARELAASLARHSSHPISQAIARTAPGREAIRDWQEFRGAGVAGRLERDSAELRLGSLNWLRENQVDLTPARTFISDWSARGTTITALAANTELVAVLAIRDELKPAARKVIDDLHRSQLKTFMVTGDNTPTAASIAKEAGIRAENVFAEVRPEHKADLVRKLQQAGERVAFVGDGINDAPALEQADLGIAVARASDIAREAADIILLKSGLEAVPESLGLARATLRTIKQNLFWAFFYNAIGVPLAALGFMSPVLCAAAMGFSDVIVIGNALRLRRFKLTAS